MTASAIDCTTSPWVTTSMPVLAARAYTVSEMRPGMTELATTRPSKTTASVPTMIHAASASARQS